LTILLWGLGSCITGFLFLTGWILKLTAGINMALKDLSDGLEKKVSFSELNKTMSTTNTLLHQIKDAICGDFKSVGLIHKFEKFEENCIIQKEAVCKKIESLESK